MSYTKTNNLPIININDIGQMLELKKSLTKLNNHKSKLLETLKKKSNLRYELSKKKIELQTLLKLQSNFDKYKYPHLFGADNEGLKKIKNIPFNCCLLSLLFSTSFWKNDFENVSFLNLANNHKTIAVFLGILSFSTISVIIYKDADEYFSKLKEYINSANKNYQFSILKTNDLNLKIVTLRFEQISKELEDLNIKINEINKTAVLCQTKINFYEEKIKQKSFDKVKLDDFKI